MQKIPKLLASDHAYQNARKHADRENIRVESELAVQRAISTILSDYIELFQQFTQNADFKERLTSFVLTLIDDQVELTSRAEATEETRSKRRTDLSSPR